MEHSFGSRAAAGKLRAGTSKVREPALHSPPRPCDHSPPRHRAGQHRTHRASAHEATLALTDAQLDSCPFCRPDTELRISRSTGGCGSVQPG
ncbi:DUF6233 domain-containing protein [Streptomyces sp. NPDC047043]|uniref:DUF6233 domain-containing protein n=1 Tax=Streptomyces sp. NPDC047043 TaxID=3154497 RepID=UPI0033EACBC7